MRNCDKRSVAIGTIGTIGTMSIRVAWVGKKRVGQGWILSVREGDGCLRDRIGCTKCECSIDDFGFRELMTSVSLNSIDEWFL